MSCSEKHSAQLTCRLSCGAQDYDLNRPTGVRPVSFNLSLDTLNSYFTNTPIFCRTSETVDSGSRSISSALRARQSRLFT